MTPRIQLTKEQRELRDDCIKVAKTGLKTALDVAAAIMQLRDDRLYLETHDSFEDFCKEVLGITRDYAYRLIGAAEVKESLPKAIADKITNERQARALTAVPEKDRPGVIRSAAKNGPLTEESLRQAALSYNSGTVLTTVNKDQPVKMGRSEKSPAEIRDRTGYLIPPKLHAEWQAVENELGAITAKISAVRSEVRKAMESSGSSLAWRRVSANAVMVALDNAYREVNAGIPFAVCPYCQGMITKTCTACKGIGFIGKFDWQTAIPKELIAIREKACKK